LPEDSWEHRHELAFALELHRGECEFLTGALAEAEQRLTALSTRAANTLERAKVTCLRAELYTTLDQGSRAIAVGLDYLQHLGINWSPHPTEREARREYERIWSQLGDRTIESLIELPLMSDPASLATLDVLAKIVSSAFITGDTNLLALITCRAVNLSLERGNCDASCSAHEWLSMVAGPHFGDYRTAVYRFGQLGYDLVERRGLTRFQARTYMDFGGSVLPWTRHVRTGRDLVRRAFEAANKVGDLNYAAYCCNRRIVKDASRASNVIGRIRELIKNAPTRKDRVDINEAIREVIELTRGEAVKNGASVRTTLGEGLPLIEGDRVGLQQVVLNLVVNALQAMCAVAEGRRELFIATARGEPNGVMVTVSDSGPGSPSEGAEHLFAPFYTTKPDGLGLGLSICRSIIDSHGGLLTVTANLPQGTVFQFTVPGMPPA
jgi:hypothetical protein